MNEGIFRNPSPQPPPRSGEGEPDFSAGAEKPTPPVANVVVGQRVEESKVARAKELRREMTLAERALWQRLRRNQVDGLHFRRQQVLFGFIADFYCHAAGLVVEVDGDVHDSQVEADEERTMILESKGFHVHRVRNDEVFKDIELVMAGIGAVCRDRLGAAQDPSPQPPPRNGEGEPER